MSADDEETDRANGVKALRSQFEQLTSSARQKDVKVPPSRQSSGTLLVDRDAATTTSAAPIKPVKPAALKSPVTSRPSSPAVSHCQRFESDTSAANLDAVTSASSGLAIAVGQADSTPAAAPLRDAEDGPSLQVASESANQNSNNVPPPIPLAPRPVFLDAPGMTEPQSISTTGSPLQRSRTPPPIPISRAQRNPALSETFESISGASEVQRVIANMSVPSTQPHNTSRQPLHVGRTPPAILAPRPSPPRQAPQMPSSSRPVVKDTSAGLASNSAVDSELTRSSSPFEDEQQANASPFDDQEGERDAGPSRPRSRSSVAPPLPARNQTLGPPVDIAATVQRSKTVTSAGHTGSFPARTDGGSGPIRAPSPRNVPLMSGANANGFAAVRSQSNGATLLSKTEDSDDDEQQDEDSLKRASELPDATFANKRPPVTRPNRKIYLQQPAQAFAICGRFAVTVTSMIRVWESFSGATLAIIDIPGERKITEVAFASSSSETSIIWVGAKDGTLYEVDIVSKRILDSRSGAHSHPILKITPLPSSDVVTIDESGKVQIWPADGPDQIPLLQSTPTTHRLADRANFLHIDGWHLWTSSGPHRHHTGAQARSPAIKVFNVKSDEAFSTTAKPTYLPDTGVEVGAVLACATIPSIPNTLYMSHDTGHISLWSKSTQECTQILKVSQYAVTSLCGVLNHLWAGNREGVVFVYDISESPWTVVKVWKAAEETVLDIRVDVASVQKERKLHIATFSRQSITYWDGFFEMDWMEQRMLKREAEFCQYRIIKVMICSWNIDSCKPADLQGSDDNLHFLRDVIRQGLDVASQSSDPPEVLVFGLQEVIDLEDKKLTAKSMLFGRKKADQKFQDGVSHQYQRWHDHLSQAVRSYMPSGTPYSVIITESMVGLLSCILVRNTERDRISDVTSLLVKTGMGGRYGNKGGILGRFVIDDSSLCFVNCHLAAGQRARRQRGKDLIDILENKSAFLQPSNATAGVYINGPGYTVFEHEICFLSGDLNYRIDLPRSVVAANIRSNNLALLLEHDQLQKELKTKHGFRLRSFREAPIDFLPTYKFDPGTDDYDSSAKERIPAWCDRILYRTHDPATNGEKVTPLSYRSWPANPSDHKPISGLFAVKTKTIIHECRSKILQECQEAWLVRQKALLAEADKHYVK